MLEENLLTPYLDLSRRQLLQGAGGGLAVAAPTTAYPISEINPPSNSAASVGARASSSQKLFERSSTYSAGAFLLEVSVRSIRLRHLDDVSRSRWQTSVSESFLLLARSKAKFREYGDSLGTFEVRDKVTVPLTVTKLDSVDVVNALALTHLRAFETEDIRNCYCIARRVEQIQECRHV